MKFRGWVASLIIALLAVNSYALSTIENEINEGLQVVTLIKKIDGLELSLSVNAPQWNTVLTENGSVEIANFNNSDIIETVGEPIVPVASRFFRLPATGGYTLNIINAEYEVISDIDYGIYLGVEGGSKKMGLSNSPEDRWFPENIVEVTSPAIMHDFRISTIQTFPVQVNPARREVRVYTSYDLEISYTGNEGINELSSEPTQISELFLNWYRNFADWNEIELDDFEIYRGSVLVVTKTAALSSLDGWIEWKRQKGWNLEFLTEADVSWNSTAIKNGIQSRYDELDGTIDYVVIIGDNGGVYNTPPTGSQGDHGYTLLAGNDQVCDVALGRISVETDAQLMNYVSKTKDYEEITNVANTEWYKHGMVAAGSGSSGMSTVRLGRQVQQLLFDIGYTVVDTAFYSSTGNVNTITTQKINDGVSYFNYRGWLGTGLSVGEISGLQNSHMTPLVIDITCGTGNWASGTGLTEAWMRAGTFLHPKGGIAAIGTATSGTHTRFNNSLSSGAYSAALVQKIPEIGATVLGAKLNLYRSFHGYDNNSVNSFNDWCNLMGDPTTWIFTDIPQALNVTHPSAIEEGMSTYDVRVSTGSTYLKGLWVTLYGRNGAAFYSSTGLTDAEGRITLEIPSTLVSTYKLTVTGQNCRPAAFDISVNESSRLGVTDITFHDDNQDGTVGNSNGIPEAGETIGLLFEVHNNHTSQHANVSITVEGNNPYIVTQGTATVGNISAGGSVSNTTPVLIEIAPTLQDKYFDYLDITFESDQGTFEDKFKLKGRAPKFAISTVTSSSDLHPGQNSVLGFTLTNIGGSDFLSGNITFVSTDPYLSVLSDNETIGNVLIGNSTTIEGFEVGAHALSFRGYQASFRAEIQSSAGQIDTAYSVVNFGSRRAVDPSGPDKYGYFAFDDDDLEYEMAPEYNWVEIDPSVAGNDYAGIRLGINDSGEDNDDSHVVILPFPMQYYGETFTHMTVTGNGMVGMGIQPTITTARNWPIPAPLGPNYMIAPFWDDRIVSGGGGVYSFYDDLNNRLIIEWSKTKDIYNAGLSTFQMIIYDIAGSHATVSGDNEILFQYKTVAATAGDFADIPYFTTGIENGNQLDGIMYNYWNTPYAGAKRIVSQSAVLFSTLTGLITGTVEGNVSALTGGLPVANANVYAGNYISTATTDENGDFVLERVVIGTHSITAMGPGLNPAVINGVVVEEGVTTTVDFEVTRPVFNISTEEINVEIGQNGSTVIDVTIANDGDGWLEYEAMIDFWGPSRAAYSNQSPVLSLDEIWDELFAFTTETNEIRNRGLTLVGRNFWTCGSNNPDAPAGAPNQLYVFDAEGQYVNTFAQPIDNPDGAGFYGLTTDGEFLYGAAAGKFYKMEYVNNDLNLVDSWDIQINPARYVEYDPVEGLFWMGDMTTLLYGVDNEGNIVRSWDVEGQIRSIAWYDGEESDQKLYFMTQDFGSDFVHISKMNTTTGSASMVHTLEVGDLTINDAIITYRWNPMVWSFIGLFDTVGAGDLIKVWELDVNSAWLSITNEDGVIQPDEEEMIPVSFNGLGLPVDEYNAWLRIDHNAVEEISFVRINMSLVGVDDDVTELPTEWKIEPAYPNPFNPTTNIRFSMVETANVSAKLYNVLGQEVATILEQKLDAGYHTMSVNGSLLSSGIYFVKFEAGPLNSTTKIILMK
jgi:Peptidase family C25/Secretion system C-terminal sorting domain/Carboxypeptidase regulatory-like domain/Propeptide_C25